MINTSADAQTSDTGAQALPEKEASEPIGPLRFAVVLALVVAADWLLYAHHLGISVLVFVLALALASGLANPVRGARGQIALAAIILGLACAPLVLMPTRASFILALIACAFFAVVLAAKPQTLANQVHNVRRLLLDCGWRILIDLVDRPWGREDGNAGRAVLAWIVPLTLGGVFIWLFALANPLIESWINAVNPNSLITTVETARVVFWAAVVMLTWPFVYVHIRAKAAAKPAAASPVERTAGAREHLLGKPALLRALLLFNVLFAIELGLDFAYLWGGVALPDGMTYATYAHRGAYPLIVTALLAAAFVMAVMQPGTEAERSPLLRWLVYLWVAQNVVLVVSSLFRLDLYIEVYSLTYWRAAAFVWMLLVACGLVLIVIRIAAKLSNAWLIKANLIALIAAVYACGYVNFPQVIADFNVTHSRELSGEGASLDVFYLRRLGPPVIPALDRLIAKKPMSNTTLRAHRARVRLTADFSERKMDWRAWTYWDWQLGQYLAAHPEPPAFGDDAADPLPAAP